MINPAIAKVKLTNRWGLHARTAVALAKTASRYSSDIKIKYNGIQSNAKDSMDILCLMAGKGEEVQIIASGYDEATALNNIVKLINNRFGETE